MLATQCIHAKSKMEGKHEVDHLTSGNQVMPDLSKFVLKRVLSDHRETKSVFIEGTFSGEPGIAIVCLEKDSFPEKSLHALFQDDFDLEKIFKNDIYSSFRYFPKSLFNGCKASVIHPATEKHISKYLYQPVHIINESPHLYKTITLPHLKLEQFTLDWLHNILNHKAEQDRIVFEDPDPEIGFILLPDFKWDGVSVESLYLLAFPRKCGILSLRDLTKDHLPLLKNLQKACLEVTESKYKVDRSRLRVYLHYQPTFYHLHIHVSHLKFNAPGTGTERAHMLSTVIDNIELLPDYYQRASIPFVIKETDSLFAKYEAENLVHRNDSRGVDGTASQAASV